MADKCEYCMDADLCKDFDFVDDLSKLSGFSIYLYADEGDKLNAIGCDNDNETFMCGVKINYCPICGRKL